MHTRPLQSFLTLALGVFSLSANADLAACKSQTKDAVANCNAAAAQVQALKNQASSAAAAASAGQGNSARGFSLQGVTKDGAAADDKGKAYCDSLKQPNCNAPCDRVTDPKEKPQADQAKKDCNNQIDAQKAKFDQSASALNNNSDDSKKTGDQAKGDGSSPSSPQSSSPSSSPSSDSTPSTPTPSSTSDTTSKANDTKSATTPASVQSASLNPGCSADLAYLNSQCSSQLAQECNQQFRTTARCENFSARYCATSGDSGQSSPGATKSGEGVASDFCKGYLSAQSTFKCGPATMSCPTCSGVTPPAGQAVPDACKSDPWFADPSHVASTLGTTAADAIGGGGGTGDGSVGAGLLGKNLTLDKEKALDGIGNREGLSLAVDSGGGGGSGGSSGGSSPYSDFKLHPSTPRSVASNGASPVVGQSPASDVEQLKGPSIFSITSEILRHRCATGKMHCGTKAKSSVPK